MATLSRTFTRAASYVVEHGADAVRPHTGRREAREVARRSLLARGLHRPQWGQHLRALLRRREEPDRRLLPREGRLDPAAPEDRGVPLGRALPGGGRLPPRRRADRAGPRGDRRGPGRARGG